MYFVQRQEVHIRVGRGVDHKLTVGVATRGLAAGGGAGGGGAGAPAGRPTASRAREWRPRKRPRCTR
eukprot:375590-Lingulodinium_polyedra.AAC.1